MDELRSLVGFSLQDWNWAYSGPRPVLLLNGSFRCWKSLTTCC